MTENQDFEQMKAQLDALRSELSRQKITSRRMMERVVRSRAAFINISDIAMLILLVPVTIFALHEATRVGWPWWIPGLLVLLIAILVVYTLITRHIDRSYLPYGTMTEYYIRMCKVRKRWKIELLVGVPIFLAFIGLVLWYGTHRLGFSTHWVLRVGLIVGTITPLLAIVPICQTRALNEIIRNIEKMRKEE